MAVSTLRGTILLLILTFSKITSGQYYDFFQGFQQVLQQFPQDANIFSQYNNHNRPITTYRNDNKKKVDSYDRRTKRPPNQQYEYIFATTTPKPTRKPTKTSSSHTNKSSNRNYNTDIIIFNDNFTPYSEVTTKRNNINPNNRFTTTTTTVNPNNIYYNNKGSTENTFNYNNKAPNNINRPITENNVQNNHGNVYTHENLQANNQDNRRTDNIASNINNNNRLPTNTRNPNVQNINLNNNNENNRPSNSRNPNVAGISNPSRFTNNKNDYGQTTNIYTNNRPNNANNDNVYNNNHGNLNTDYDVGNNYYSGNPIIRRPGVKPIVIDVNQPPITNKPLTDKNNFLPFDRPFDQGRNERPAEQPEILIGPDEDDMSASEKRRYFNMAETFCDRYKSLNVKEVVALPLLPSAEPVEFNVTSCVPTTVPLVIGGRVVTINEFPHMALVGWKKIQSAGYSWKCGASLISEQYLLTAGHCTYQDKDYDVQSGPPQAVQLGSSYHDDPGATVVKISAVIRHPKYKQRRSYYDVALIKMAHTVRFSEVIRPACLGVPPSVGENIIATGWGRTEFGGDHSKELRSVSLKVWNMAECREIWGTSLKLPDGPSPDSHLCAGDKRGGKDTCQGDSGGPAQIQDGCVWRVVAVTSFGRSCGAPNTPALYAVNHIPFIAAQVFADGQVDRGSRNEDRRFEDRRQPVYSERQDSYSIRPPWLL